VKAGQDFMCQQQTKQVVEEPGESGEYRADEQLASYKSNMDSMKEGKGNRELKLQLSNCPG